MKKSLSIILSLALMLSMSVTTFAENVTSGTQTVSVDVPTPCYDYTVHIPADCSIEYGNTELQSIGTVTVTSDYWANILTDYKSVVVMYEFEYYMTTVDGDRLPCMIGEIDNNGLFNPMISREQWEFKQDGGAVDSRGSVYIEVPDWSKAEPGKSYSITITYTSRLLP